MFLLIIIGALILFLLLGLMGKPLVEKINKKNTDVLNSTGVSEKDLFVGGNLVGGHPHINESIKNISFAVSHPKRKILIFSTAADNSISLRGSIPCDAIKNIVVEDATTVEKRVTIGRMLLVGLFAIAWKKKRVNELGFLIIEWNEGRFDHETIFSFEGKGSLEVSNKVRNQLIRLIPS